MEDSDQNFTLTYARYDRPWNQGGLGVRKEYVEVKGLKECRASKDHPLMIACMDLKWLGKTGRSVGIQMEGVTRNRLSVNENGDYAEVEFASLEATIGYIEKDSKSKPRFASKIIEFAPSDCGLAREL